LSKKVSKLRKCRLLKGLTLWDIYLKTNRKLPPSKVSLIERKIFEPSQTEKTLLSKILGKSQGELFDD